MGAAQFTVGPMPLALCGGSEWIGMGSRSPSAYGWL
jgi:hypothetical protein